MGTNVMAAEARDRGAVLSALWIFVVFNYLYADLVMTIVRPEAYQKVAARMGEGVMLGATVLMEILIAMVLLPRVLKYRLNRWANIIAGALGTAFVAFTLVGGRPPASYLLLSIIEIAGTLFIIWYAWTWPDPEGRNPS